MTEEQKSKAVELYKEGKGEFTIGRALGVPRHIVRRFIKTTGLYRDAATAMAMTRKTDEFTEMCAVDLFKQGYGYKAVAKELEIKPSRVVKIAMRHKLNRGNGYLGIGKVAIKDNPDRLIMEGYKSESRSLAKWDESRHWGNHPTYTIWASYYRNHEASKKRSRDRERIKHYQSGFDTDLKEWRTKKLIRSRVYNALKHQNSRKNNRTVDLIGCSIKHLIQHLESQFVEGMSWSNQGDWHIDHIIPCASFDLTSEDQQRICFHYTNLRPAWARDNLTKSDKLPNGLRGRFVVVSPTARGNTSVGAYRDGGF